MINIEFDYYIYVDYSKNLAGYSIIEKNKIKELIPKIKKTKGNPLLRDVVCHSPLFLGCSEMKTELSHNYPLKGAVFISDITRFRHYREAGDKKLYLKNIKNTIKRDNIYSYFLKIKIRNICKNIEIYSEVLAFLKTHKNCIIFVSIDNHEYSSFERLVKIVDGENVVIKKESELKKGTIEYQISLVIDNILNIERLKDVK